MIDKGKVTLLDIKLLENELLDEFSYWSQLIKWIPGWHYDLDMSWLLKKIESLNLKKGSTILDAGAGQGIMQYILASRGFNIVSLDFSKRKIPNILKKKFNIVLHDQESLDYKHSYQEFIQFEPDNIFKLDRIKKLFYPQHVFYKIKRNFLSLLADKKYKNNSSFDFGSIEFVRASFHDIPFDNNYFDAVISTSAIEHSDFNLLDQNINELTRVAKKSGGVFITTSGTNKSADIYDDETGGWCFCSKTISKYASNSEEEYSKYQTIDNNIIESDIIRSRIDSYYFLNKNSPFYKNKIKNIPYCPIGISLFD